LTQNIETTTFPHTYPEDNLFACDFDALCKLLFLNAKKAMENCSVPSPSTHQPLGNVLDEGRRKTDGSQNNHPSHLRVTQE